MPCILSWEQRRYLRATGELHVHRFGGSSSSRQETTNTDARVVGGDGSSNASIVGNQGDVSVITTDHGAVKESLQLALAGVENARATTEQALASTGGLLDGALRNSATQAQAFVDTIKDVKTSDVRVLVIAGLGVVGLAAVMLLKNKG